MWEGPQAGEPEWCGAGGRGVSGGKALWALRLRKQTHLVTLFLEGRYQQ